jgi:cell division protein FtsQ
MIRKVRNKVQAQRTAPVEVERRRHPLLSVVGVVAFLMFAYGGYLTQQLFDPHAFPIRKIAVEGEFHHLTSEHVQRLVSNAVHGGFFDVDVVNVRTRILDEPWIFDASVRRVWPDTIRVSIREQNAVARWGEYALLNQDADIFVPDSSAIPSGLVVLDGPIGTESELLRRYSAIQETLDPIDLRVARINLSDRRAWAVEIKDGATLVVGRHAVAERLGRFSRAFEHALKENWTHVALVDLRYTNGFAIREKNGATDNG